MQRLGGKKLQKGRTTRDVYNEDVVQVGRRKI